MTLFDKIYEFISEHLFTLLWILLFTLLGSFANYWKKIKTGEVKKFRVFEIIGDILISFFLGIVTYLICIGSGINDIITAGIVGFVSHLGTRALILIDQILPIMVCKFLGLSSNCVDKEEHNNDKR